jgi:hypothetical protein
MRIESNYPTPIQGVSTLASRNRARGQAGLQLNMRSDPVKKLTRRPSVKWETRLTDTNLDLNIHSYYRQGKDIHIIVDENGAVFGFVNGESKPVTGDFSTYFASSDLKFETINDTTFIVNSNIVTGMLSDTDTVQEVSHVNVTSALGYGEELHFQLGDDSPAVVSHTITIGSAEDATTSDVQRRTNAVADSIAVAINGATTGLHAQSKGSSVAIWTDNNTPQKILISSGGGGDNVVAFNSVTESITGLPLYARIGTRITVKPDPTSDDGTYYLDAVGLAGETVPNSVAMEEVVWTESRSPIEEHTIDETTMPHTIRYDYITDSFIRGVPELGWDERTKGDNESVPLPAFIGRTITALGQFQKRLVLISENDVEMTVTDNLFNWFKQSAIDLLVTDPISITSNSTGIDVLQYILEHNRDLMIIASNGQFKIDGTQGITPQTVAMPLTTSQEIQVSVPPVSIGSAVFLPINYGTSTGVTEYTGQRDQSDIAQPITHHVIGYMEGEAKLLASSPNLEMLAVTTTDSASNVVFIYEQFTDGGKKLQRAWSTWELPTGNDILHIAFRRDKLTLVVRVGTKVLLKTIDMYSRVGVNTAEVYLDDLVTLSSNGTSVTLPNQYVVTSDTIVVGGDGTKYPLFKVGYTQDGLELTFDKSISVGTSTVYIGQPYRSAYQPTRPFREDEQGVAITSDRIRINRYVLDVVETERVTMTTHAKYSTPPDQLKSHRVLNTLTNNVGSIDMYTGTFQFSYAQNADYSEAEFWTEGWLGMTIAGISWKGQYHRSSGRL